MDAKRTCREQEVVQLDESLEHMRLKWFTLARSINYRDIGELMKNVKIKAEILKLKCFVKGKN
jgi:hypothetical protein